MQTITKTLRTVAAMAMILAGFALASGWMSVATFPFSNTRQ